MNNDDVLFESSIPELPLIGRGKVRDIYSIDEQHLLLVTTDRLSAYDVVMPDPVPGKGEVLTKISLFWFRMMGDIVDNQLTDLTVADVVKDPALREQLKTRSLVVKRVEAVVRGYLIGSGWKDYQETGQVCGIDLPGGLQQAEKLPKTLFTPAYKAEAGAHDENISFEKVVELVGEKLASRVRDMPTHSSAASSSLTQSSSSASTSKVACTSSMRY
jgi:phosphoribosylaminoimidazole-succinocarboxamide synthase